MTLLALALIVAAAKPAPAPAKPAPAKPAQDQPAPVYHGLGAESVAPEVLQTFAPPPLAPEESRRIQAMLDVRAPGAGEVSPDGRRLFFTWNVTGQHQLWRLDGPQRFPVQLTGGEDRASLAGVAPDGSYILVSRDRGGEENPGLYWQAAEGGPLNVIQHVKGVQTFAEYISDDGSAVYFRANDRKPDSFALYRWDKKTGERSELFTEDGLWSVADHRPNGRLLLNKDLGSSVSEIYEYDPAQKALTPVIGQGEREEFAAAYGPTDGEVLILTPKLGEFRRLYSWHQGKALAPVSPELPHDVATFLIDESRKRILYTVNEGGYARLHVVDARTYKPVALPKLPDADQVNPVSVTRDGRFATLFVDFGISPWQGFVLDLKDEKLTPWQLPSAPEIEVSRFSRASLESYPARDGTPIPMLVWRPKSCAAPCPVVVEFHGGPEGQSTPGFSTYAQMVVDAGFVFVRPNVRGSDGYGKTWYHADDRGKRLDIITDIEDCARFIRQHWGADGREPKVGISGGSYGGYSSLIGMTMFAGAYDAGVSNVGIANLETFLVNTAPYRRMLRVNEYGDPASERSLLLQLSPTTYVDRIRGPLMIIQGANDPRVPVGEALQMHRALQARKLDSPLIIFPDEGHGTSKRSNQVLAIGHTLHFLQQHLLPKP